MVTQTTTIKNDDYETLFESLEIKCIERRRTGADGTWVAGTIDGHRFVVLVFPVHAENPEYELDNSRISKLWLQRCDDQCTAANFDRGWDVRPATETAGNIVAFLTDGLAEHVYGC